MQVELEFLIIIIVFIIGLLLTDLLVIGRKSHKVKTKEALIWTCIWIVTAFLFFLYLRYHGEKLHGITNFEELKQVKGKYMPDLLMEDDYSLALETYRINLSINYLTVYFIEKTLSVDNIFVIILILNSLYIPDKYHKQVLFWGIMGAIVFRFLFIFVGAALIRKFDWILYIFGGILLISAVRMLIKKKADEKQFREKRVNKFLIQNLPLYPRIVKDHFFIKKNTKIYFTLLFLALIIIEFTDIIFAFDSIPAAFSISRDPYIIFFANIFAILGLRALFFLLANAVDTFRYLKAGVGILLVFVALKLLFHNWLELVHFKNTYSLIFILSIIFISILLSIIFPSDKFKQRPTVNNL